MFKTGLVSITFRKLSIEEIINITKIAKLDAIEWGGDVHVPPGNIEMAKKVRQMMSDASLVTSAYGSYLRLGMSENNDELFAEILQTAIALGTKVIRVWASRLSPSEATEEFYQKVVNESQAYAELAKKEGIKISYEYHWNTLTETNESAIRLLNLVNHENVITHWQPSKIMNLDERIEGLKQVLPYVTQVHTFYWIGSTRYPLSDGIHEWKKYIDIIKEKNEDVYLLIEHVKDDSVDQFFEDAKTLKQLLES